MMRLRQLGRGLALTAATAIPLALLPAGALAKEPAEYGTATVLTVDGPGALTIRSGKRAVIRVRLAPIDLPKVGECGATEATAALRGFVDRAPRKLRYNLIASVDGLLVRDADGRYAVQLWYAIRNQFRDLADDLIRADWGRSGEPGTLDGVSKPDGNLMESSNSGGGTREASPRPRRGLWARCGGFAHLPLNAPVPDTSAQTWQVDEQGITGSIGAIALSPTLARGNVLTLRQLAAVGPAEVTWASEVSCRVWLPSLQFRAFGFARGGANCGDAFVESVRSIGPVGAQLTRGGALGTPAAELRSVFPNLVVGSAYDSWRLYGPDQRQWAWQTEVEVDATKRATGLVTYRSPTIPG